MQRKDSSPKHSYCRNLFPLNSPQPSLQKTYPQPVLELLEAIAKKLQNKSIQVAQEKSTSRLQNNCSSSFSFEAPILSLKELICYLKDTGGRFEEKTLWQILKMTIYGCASMEDCFLCFDDFDINTFSIFQSDKAFSIKIKHIYSEGERCFNYIEKLDELISIMPVDWRREEIVFDSVNRTNLLRRELNKRSNPFLSFLTDFNQKVRKSVRAVFGLILRISIYEFERNNDNKMRILKSRLLILLRERGYSELFVGFTIGVLFTKDTDSLFSFSELRNRMETGSFDSKDSFESFSSLKPNFMDKGIKQLQGTGDELGSNFSFLVNSCLSSNKPVIEKLVNVKNEEYLQSGPKRLLKNKSSDESFNYQSYLMRVTDEHPELSEIIQHKKVDNIMRGSDDGDTLNSLASYLRKGGFGRPENKHAVRVRSTFNQQKQEDTLNLTMGEEKIDKRELEESNKSDIELSGLQNKQKEERVDYKELINNFDNELGVDEELDSINKKINNLKLRIQKHKRNLVKKSEGEKMMLTNINDFDNNKEDTNKLNITEERRFKDSPKQVHRGRYLNPTSVSKKEEGRRVGRTRTVSVTRGNVENRYKRFNVQETNQENNPKEVYSVNYGNTEYHKRSISSSERGQSSRFGRGSGFTEKRIIRGGSRSSSFKRRIKLESVGTNFFKELVSKEPNKESYGNYYFN